MNVKFNCVCRKFWLSFFLSLNALLTCALASAQAATETTTTTAKDPAPATKTANAKAKKVDNHAKKKAVPAGTPQGNRSVADAANKPSVKKPSRRSQR